MMILASNPKLCLKPFSKAFEEVRKEFEGWEFLAENLHGWDHRDEIKNVLSTSDMEIQVHAPLNDINTASVNPRMRKAALNELEKTFELASMIDSKIVTLHPGFHTPIGRYWEGAEENCIESLKELKKTAEEYGITPALENMPKLMTTMCTTPEEMQYFLDQTGMDFCLDIGHAHTADRLKEFLEFKPVNVHIHDNEGGRDVHYQLGKGRINFKQVIKKLSDYRGNWVIEGRDMGDLSKSKEYLMKLLSKI